jgi:hypothetical protein
MAEQLIKPTCPECGSHDVAEMVSTRMEYPVAGVIEGVVENAPGVPVGDGYFDGFRCGGCHFESNEITDFIAPDPGFEPQYEKWRGGGWYVFGVRHKNGGCGCVSRNYPDRKWRIVCDSRDGDHTYLSRDEAARTEYALCAAGLI